MEHPSTVPDYLELRAEMVRRGTSLTDWSRQRGYQPRYVIYVVKRYAGRAQGPRGAIARRLIRDLGRELSA